MKLRMWKWGDLLIAVATVAAALSIWGISAFSVRVPAGSTPIAVIRISDGSEQRFALKSGNASTNLDMASGGLSYIIRFEGDRVRVLQANCPDQVCVVTGWLSRPGQLAACVPGRLLIRVVAGSTADGVDPGVDAVSQ